MERQIRQTTVRTECECLPFVDLVVGVTAGWYYLYNIYNHNSGEWKSIHRNEKSELSMLPFESLKGLVPKCLSITNQCVGITIWTAIDKFILETVFCYAGTQ